MGKAPLPKPRLTARVGVTGHRPERLVGADAETLRREIRAVLAAAAAKLSALRSQDAARGASAFSAEPPLLRVVSSLAEGADRLVAREARALLPEGVDVELVCPLPFAREEYARDFSPDGRREFEALLAGSFVFELDGSREGGKADEAYEAAGRAMLDTSDILIAVWDGQGARGRGGTGQIVAEAARRGRPVVWVHVGGGKAHAACLLAWSDGPACGAMPDISSLLDGLLKPPAS